MSLGLQTFNSSGTLILDTSKASGQVLGSFVTNGKVNVTSLTVAIPTANNQAWITGFCKNGTGSFYGQITAYASNNNTVKYGVTSGYANADFTNAVVQFIYGYY